MAALALGHLILLPRFKVCLGPVLFLVALEPATIYDEMYVAQIMLSLQCRGCLDEAVQYSLPMPRAALAVTESYFAIAKSQNRPNTTLYLDYLALLYCPFLKLSHYCVERKKQSKVAECIRIEERSRYHRKETRL